MPSFFTDLIRTMERSGLSGDVAREVALALARNPKLDEVAALTIAGCLPAYLAATADGVDTALADLTAYIQHPNEHASRAEARFQLLGRDMLTRIEDKVRNGNPAAAELIMEHALLARFNPKLGAKILVPQ